MNNQCIKCPMKGRFYSGDAGPFCEPCHSKFVDNYYNNMWTDFGGKWAFQIKDFKSEDYDGLR